ncbi:WW domain-containing adapter protein with coiled-coil-like isoform X2 [Corticium candelabrum]|uniref:WW domain-containing adapter protein with coiled-coil-like isoform X2 n=1 Tax=Corticium candelabrum TaxID=121492 RepID=UPI002E261F05|nr:WW domain-containing adapter protein with coiled-coil-like isoform X2 [Corticium candelabrum]
MSSGTSSKAQGSSEQRHHPYKASSKIPPRKAILNSWTSVTSSTQNQTLDCQSDVNRDNKVKAGNEENWSEHTSSSGRKYYFNKKTGVSQWEVPQELRKRSKRSSSRSKESSPVQQQQPQQQPQQQQQHQQQQEQKQQPQDQQNATRALPISSTPQVVSSSTSTPVQTPVQTPSRISDALGVQEISPPSTPSNSVSSCVNHQALTPRALYTMTQHQAGGVGQPGVILFGGQTLSGSTFVRTPVVVPSVATPVAVTPIPLLPPVDNQLTQLYSRHLAQPVMQMLPEIQERQAQVSSDEWLYLETQHLPRLQCKCHVSRLWHNRTELQTLISKHELSVLGDQLQWIQRPRTQDPG